MMPLDRRKKILIVTHDAYFLEILRRGAEQPPRNRIKPKGGCGRCVTDLLRRQLNREYVVVAFRGPFSEHISSMTSWSFFVDAYIAVILGRLTDAIISHDADYLKNNLILICACLIFKIICEPLIFAFFSAKSVSGLDAASRGKLLLHYLDKPYE